MNKYLTLILSFYLVQFSYAQIQSGKVIYKIISPTLEEITDFHGDEENINDYNKEVYENILKIIPNVDLELYFNSEESFLEVKEQMSIDNETGSQFNFVLSFAGTLGAFYNNIRENLSMYQKEGKRITSDLNMLDWEIHEETKEIHGYKCIKATTSLPSIVGDLLIVAWFTPELPFPFGPQQVRGLPGLVLEMKFRDLFYYYTESIDLHSKSQKIKKPTQEKEMSWYDYIKFEIENHRSFIKSQGWEDRLADHHEKILEKYTPQD